MDEKVEQDCSAEDEDRTVEVLDGWLIDDGRQDEVAGNQAQQKRQNNRYLQGSNQHNQKINTQLRTSKNLACLDCNTHLQWSVEVFPGETQDYESQR